MVYANTVKGRFLSRPNRFIARVEIGDNEETVHVKNTSRCRELLIPGASVILALSDNPKRKTLYDLIAVYKEGLGWVNIDSQAPNALVKEWLLGGQSIFGRPDLIKPEYTHGHSRVDFYLECGKRRILIEVKGCTLEINGKGYFPDAPTERGVKHLRELTEAAAQGFECYIAFVITMPRVYEVFPNMDTHPAFGEALEEAVKAGVKVLCLPCQVEPDQLRISDLQGIPKTVTAPSYPQGAGRSDQPGKRGT